MSEILNILNKNLGSSYPTNKGNQAFRCPFCNHHKNKLEVSLVNYHWNCWVCGSRGTNLFGLLKKVGASPTDMEILNELMPSVNRRVISQDAQTNTKVFLPNEYTPLWIPDQKNFFWKTCIKYLESRNVMLHDIVKYNIGYCSTGQFENMIIFPNYNKDGELNYFTTRSFIKQSKNKFKNPYSSRDVIGFEMQVNYNLPIILVESALDAIVIKRNACPLYGTIILPSLKEWILDHDIKDIYLCLDNDALKKSIIHAEYLMGHGVNVYFVELPEGGDPNKLGYTKIWELINKAEKLDNNKLFKFKILSTI